MYLQSIQVDGFKSYSSKATIGPFAPNFNCISGLNGTGKSNILDAITFVIGCKDLSLMRCTHLSDLIYKQGNAHVKRASVSLVFNNQDKLKAPNGFENMDELTVTRIVSLPNKTKYLLNGNAINNVQITSLFASIGLNPATPNNFIIFQGKITKIIMMKPHELGQLLKEAAGTLHYEQRKDNAEKVLDKKTKKVDEISATLEEEVLPKIKEYQQQRQDYLTLKQLAVDLEAKLKFIMNLDFSLKSMQLETKSAEYEQMMTQLQEYKLCKSELEEKLKENAQSLKTLEQPKSSQYESDLKESQLQVTKNSSKIKLLSTDIDQITKEKEMTSKELKMSESKLKSMENHSDIIESHAKAKQERDVAVQQLKMLQSMVDGELEVEKERIHLKCKQLQQTLNKSQSKISALEKEWSKYHEAQFNAAQSDLDSFMEAKTRIFNEAQLIVNDLRTFNNNDPITLDMEVFSMLMTGLTAQQGDLKNKFQKLHQQQSTSAREKSNLENQFKQLKRPIYAQYLLMEKKIKGVLGMIGQFIQCPSKYATAISVAGGAKLKHIVVESDTVAAYVLKNVKLEQRLSFVPLNSLKVYNLNDKLNKAKELGAIHILDVIEFPKEMEKVMDYTFNCFICPSNKIAEKVAYSLHVKCVTLDGDVYDPKGLVSGGKSFNNQMMKRFMDLNELQDRINGFSSLSVEKEALLKQQSTINSFYDQLNHLYVSLNRVEKQIAQPKQVVQSCQMHLQDLKAEQASIKEIELELQQYESLNSFKGKESDLKAQLKLVNQLEQTFAKLQKQLDAQNANKDQIVAELDSHQTTLSDLEIQLNQLRKDLLQCQQQHNQFTNQFDHYNQLHQQDLLKNKKFKQQQNKLIQDQNTIQIQLDDQKLAMKTVRHNTDQLKCMLNELNDFLADSAHLTLIPLEPIEPHRKELQVLQKQHDKLKLNVNLQVMSMIDVAEQEQKSLSKMLDQVHMDKEKIEGAIEALDKHKLTAVEATWQQVTTSFGKILQGILPNSYAKLVPDPNGILNGCEIKVELNGKWKDSLSELSGGQRSLVAISLILSLLQFKTSPLYILDEVDAGILY